MSTARTALEILTEVNAAFKAFHANRSQVALRACRAARNVALETAAAKAGALCA